jgi:hypothetical protein
MANSKPVKQEVNGTVILPLLVFPGYGNEEVNITEPSPSVSIPWFQERSGGGLVAAEARAGKLCRREVRSALALHRKLPQVPRRTLGFNVIKRFLLFLSCYLKSGKGHLPLHRGVK